MNVTTFNPSLKKQKIVEHQAKSFKSLGIQYKYITYVFLIHIRFTFNKVPMSYTDAKYSKVIEVCAL